ncbi:MAG: trypsin-like peptidase domain-containing protein [Variibacter sp.]|nr:trypsin-like peptidase domain-containing protein [Variibacter sp.]
MSERTNRLLLVLLIVVGTIAVEPYLRPYLQPYLFASANPRPVEPRGDLSPLEQATIQLFERVSPSTVQVVARAPSAESSLLGFQGSAAQSGTGFLWDAAGHVVTNDHVVEGTSAVAVRFGSGEVKRAEVIGVAPHYDLAVLRILAPGPLPPPVPLGASADLKVGQAVFAIGNPFGLNQTLTTGVISGLHRRLPTNSGREIADVIQTDAAINPGNSGGPLLDSAGRLIGVNTAIVSPSGSNAGIGFAIPVDTVNRVVPQLIAKGRVPTPGIGIIAANEAVATQLGVEGVVVVRTIPGSPAERAGLRGVDTDTGTVGDIIVGVNDKPVRQLADLTNELEQVGVGKSVRLTVRRNGSTRKVDVQVIDLGQSS